MIKELTQRPYKKEIRKVEGIPIDKEWEKPISFTRIKEDLSRSSDIVFRNFILRGKEEIPCVLGVVDGLVDKHLLDSYVLRVIMVDAINDPAFRAITMDTIHDRLLELFTPANEVKKVSRMGEAIDAMLSGDAVLFIEESQEALVISARGWENRGVTAPQNESSIRGPKEGFNETLRTNTSLLRRRIKHPSLRLVSMKIGDLSKTDVVIAYIENVARADVVAEVLRRIGRIQINGVISGDILEELIEDHPYSPFPQVYNTERPDIVASDLLEGRVAIIVDGTPSVLIVPVTMAKFMQVNEDYYERAMIVVLIRSVRYWGAFIAVLAPSLYIAVTTFHQELIPTSLALSISAGRDAVPFSALGEALLMLLALEILQEAGLRLPKPIGQTIGIVGALIIGDAAVKASLISPIMVIVIGLTAVSSYTIPSYDLAMGIRLIRLPLMILAGTMGFFGLGVGLYLVLIHVLGLRSFGTPYLSPIAPLRIRAFLQDTFVRAPWWASRKIPELVDTHDPKSGGKK
ncbi:spore germination protein [Desulfitobacterium dichloroeliminans]|nr:spore germination protein [Desulfitobacterium dichloroeliminans]